jgi:ribosomal protein L40E
MRGNSSHDVRSRIAVMSSTSCSFCQHANPADAKFCNECGSPLNLEPCLGCGAVNDVHALRCHACGTALDDATVAETNDVAVATDVSHGVTATVATRIEPSCPSIVKALETVEADLATLSRSEAVAGLATADASEQHDRQANASPSHTHRLRPALFGAFVACALAGVVLAPRLPLPPALSRAALATTSLVPAGDALETAPVQHAAPPMALEAPAQDVAPPLPATASARTSSGPIEAIVPSAASMISVPGTTTDAAQPVSASALLPPPMQNEPGFRDVGGLPYPVPRERCTDGVAAMALCNREGAKDVR